MLPYDSMHLLTRPNVDRSETISHEKSSTPLTEEERSIVEKSNSGDSELKSDNPDVTIQEEEYELNIVSMSEVKTNPKAYQNELFVSYMDSMFHNLMRQKTNTIILYGSKGCGKTTLIRQVCYNISKQRCPERMKGTRVFEINGLAFQTVDAPQRLFDSLHFLYLGGIRKVLIYISDFHKVGEELRKNWTDLLIEINETFNFEYLKFVLEFNSAYSEIVSLSGLTECISIQYQLCDNFDVILKTLQKNIRNLEKAHGGIKIPKRMLDKLVFWIYSSDCQSFSYKYFLHVLDYALAIAETQGDSKTLTISHVKTLFQDDFEAKSNYSEALNRVIARHEAGHTLMTLIFERYFELKGVRVLNYSTNGGGTFRVPKDLPDTLGDRNYILAELSINLAGRICQGGTYDLGAADDIRKANETAETFVLLSGTIESLGYHCTFDLEKGHYPDRVIDTIYEEKKKLLNEAEALARAKIEEYKPFIDELTEALLDNLMLHGKEVKMMFSKYSK